MTLSSLKLVTCSFLQIRHLFVLVVSFKTSGFVLNGLQSFPLSKKKISQWIFVSSIPWWQQLLYGGKLDFETDTVMATVYIVQRGRSKSIPIMKLIRTLSWTAAVKNFYFSARHVPGKFNQTADSLSRFLFQKFREFAPTADQHPQQCPAPAQIQWE